VFRRCRDAGTGPLRHRRHDLVGLFRFDPVGPRLTVPERDRVGIQPGEPFDGERGTGDDLTGKVPELDEVMGPAEGNALEHEPVNLSRNGSILRFHRPGLDSFAATY
jgi:hypothetical protein